MNSAVRKKKKKNVNKNLWRRTADESNVILNRAEKKQADEITVNAKFSFCFFFPFKSQPNPFMQRLACKLLCYPEGRGGAGWRGPSARFWKRNVQGVGSRDFRGLIEPNA